VVYQQTPQGTRTVDRLFKADFFGERALLTEEPRSASLPASGCHELSRDMESAPSSLHDYRLITSCRCLSGWPLSVTSQRSFRGIGTDALSVRIAAS